LKELNIFCFGFGQVAKEFIKKLLSEKYNLNIAITTRQESNIIEFLGQKISNFEFNNDKIDKNIFKKLKNFDHILISIPPEHERDLVLKYFSKEILDQNIKWITYLSATSVYGNHEGKWVDENSKTLPKSKNGVERLAVEKAWLKMYEKNNIPLQIFRLSGIYSNIYNVLERIRSGNASLIRKENQFFSRIHIEDIASLLFLSLNKLKKGEIFNISDDKPASSEEVMKYGAKILNLPEPKEIKLEDIQSEMLKAFYRDSKKVSNKKVKEFFNYDFKFPTYVEGLNYINKIIY
tara:strand:+ start:1409 stop:2284 length:876 start_codon:yes stop_codon:yes gene_type:complete